MFRLSNVYLLSAIATGVVAGQLVGLSPAQNIEGRSVVNSGGWSLAATQCPSDTLACGASWCCPSSQTCVHTGGSDPAEACCPSATSCIEELQVSPVCADSSWVLWNTTEVSSERTTGDTGYLCCLPGQIGVLTDSSDGVCVIPGSPPAAASLSLTLLYSATGASGSVNTQSLNGSATSTGASTAAGATTTAGASTAAGGSTTAAASAGTSATAASAGSSGGGSSTASASPSASTTGKTGAGNMIVPFVPLGLSGLMLGAWFL